MTTEAINRIAIIGNHTPRQCGIATFTADLAEAIAGRRVDVQVVAMTDKAGAYDYPDIVKFSIDQHQIRSYEEAAEYLNSQSLDVISVQHEYGIFGGPAGSYLLHCLREVKAPIVTTLHTVLQKPDQYQLAVLTELSQLSERLIVMSQYGRSMLVDDAGFDSEKVKLVHHGIPTTDHSNPEPYRKRLGLSGKQVILTFGLIAPDKGVEYMIQAMPDIVASYPDTFYLIVGATHPNVRAECGEEYRNKLIALTEELRLTDSVGFVDKFVSLEELKSYLQAADIYVTPYLKRDQVTSGTLAYAFGSGKAVVSTPYWHAQEMLSRGRGILVPFKDSGALAHEIGRLLSDPHLLRAVQDHAYQEGQAMRWPFVAAEYIDVFKETVEASKSLFPILPTMAATDTQEPVGEAEFGLDHLLAITDDTGILQHSRFSVPNRNEGYCTDDNARLAIVGCRLERELGHARLGIKLQQKGLAFLQHAYNPELQRFRNFMSYDRRWLDDCGSADAHGRALWALGTVYDMSSVASLRALAKELFEAGLPAVSSFENPRAVAFSILGLERMLAAEYSQRCLSLIGSLGISLNRFFTKTSDPVWRWFEPQVTYDNARLPQALMAAGRITENDEMISNAKIALAWLTQIQTSCCGCFIPIGSNGFYPREGVRADYDQQPVDAAATVEACAEAYALSGESAWKGEAHRAFNWFLGENSESQSLIDDDTGGCRDALVEGGFNPNQGAESTLAFIASCLTIKQMDRTPARRGTRYMG